VAISANYKAGKVNVEGTIAEVADAKKITHAFEQVPGVASVVSTIQLQPQLFTTRIYFEAGSTQLEFKDINQIMAIQRFLNQYPETHLKIIGHSDNVGNVLSNQQLALRRAIAIKEVLQAQGIAPWRLHVSGTTNLPPGVNPDQPLDLSRCVRFELFIPLEHTQ
jgi:outer membrane protein OmpA-like peptidoglycan-associated protein